MLKKSSEVILVLAGSLCGALGIHFIAEPQDTCLSFNGVSHPDQLPGATETECKLACVKRRDECKALDYNPVQNDCYLKSITKAEAPPGYYELDCWDGSDWTHHTFVDDGCFKFQKVSGIEPNDLLGSSLNTADSMVCGRKCTENDMCIAFGYHASTGECKLTSFETSEGTKWDLTSGWNGYQVIFD